MYFSSNLENRKGYRSLVGFIRFSSSRKPQRPNFVQQRSKVRSLGRKNSISNYSHKKIGSYDFFQNRPFFARYFQSEGTTSKYSSSRIWPKNFVQQGFIVFEAEASKSPDGAAPLASSRIVLWVTQAYIWVTIKYCSRIQVDGPFSLWSWYLALCSLTALNSRIVPWVTQAYVWLTVQYCSRVHVDGPFTGGLRCPQRPSSGVICPQSPPACVKCPWCVSSAFSEW